jgi:hypothetical protein
MANISDRLDEGKDKFRGTGSLMAAAENPTKRTRKTENLLAEMYPWQQTDYIPTPSEALSQKDKRSRIFTDKRYRESLLGE